MDLATNVGPIGRFAVVFVLSFGRSTFPDRSPRLNDRTQRLLERLAANRRVTITLL